MRALIGAALLLVACGGSTGPGEVETAVTGGDGGAAAETGGSGGAVPPSVTNGVLTSSCSTGTTFSCPMGCLQESGPGYHCTVANGSSNACGAQPIAGYVVCCSDLNGEAPGVSKILIPGGPADPCLKYGPTCFTATSCFNVEGLASSGSGNCECGNGITVQNGDAG